MKMGKDFPLDRIAHEMFHGYQHEMGQGGASIFNEVEAYLFGYSIAYQYYDSGPTGTGTENFIGFVYERSFRNLIFSDKFSTEDFTNAIMHFRVGSSLNINGDYSNYPLRRINQRNSLIKRFYPLIEF